MRRKSLNFEIILDFTENTCSKDGMCCSNYTVITEAQEFRIARNETK